MKIIFTTNIDIFRHNAPSIHTIELISNLQKLGVVPLLIVPAERKDFYLPFKVSFPGKRQAGSPIKLLNYQLRLFKFLKKVVYKFQPDFIYSRFNITTISPGIVSRLHGIPYILEVNGIFEEEGRIQGHPNLIIMLSVLNAYLNFRLADKVIFSSPFFIEHYAKKFPRLKCKFFAVPNGFNPEHFYKGDKKLARKHLGFCEKDFIILFCGGLKKWQRLDLFFLALRSLKGRESKGIRFLILGDGDNKANLKKLVNKFGLYKNVYFLKEVHRKLVGEYIRASDICFDVRDKSQKAYFPLKTVEYLACGRTAITNTYRAEYFKSLAKKEILLSGDTVFNIKQSLERVLNDRKKLYILGEAGANFVHKYFTWHHAAQKTLNILSIN